MEHPLEHCLSVYIMGGIVLRSTILVKSKGQWISPTWEHSWDSLKAALSWFSEGKKKAYAVKRK